MLNRERRVVITGIGPVTPIGVGRDEFWLAARQGRSGVGALDGLPDGFDVGRLRSRIAARVAGGTQDAHVDRRLWLGELAATLALRDADLPDLAGLDTAIVMGNAVAAPLAVEQAHRDPAGSSESLLQWMSFHSVAHHLARVTHCRGMTSTIATGCTAGLDAVMAAFDLVRSGQCDVALAGAAEAPLAPIVFSAFDMIGALSRRNDDPAHASRPFDRERDGFVLAEGAAMLVLEERERALRRRAHVYAEIAGYGSTSNAYHMTNLPADGASVAECITAALVDARLSPADIDSVNAHGSSTPQNDICETNAVKSVFGAQAYRLSVNSTKSMVGHALGAANAIELAMCALELSDQYVAPTANLTNPSSDCDLDYVPNAGRRERLRALVKLGNGFSGIHTAAVMVAA